MLEPTTWRMCAHRYDSGLLFNIGSRFFVDNHGLREPVVDVDVREVAKDDPAGTHWGWMDAKDDSPCMIWPRRILFDMCFTYGPEIEERHGRGRIVRLAVTEVADDA